MRGLGTINGLIHFCATPRDLFPLFTWGKGIWWRSLAKNICTGHQMGDVIEWGARAVYAMLNGFYCTLVFQATRQNVPSISIRSGMWRPLFPATSKEQWWASVMVTVVAGFVAVV